MIIPTWTIIHINFSPTSQELNILQTIWITVTIFCGRANSSRTLLNKFKDFAITWVYEFRSTTIFLHKEILFTMTDIVPEWNFEPRYSIKPIFTWWNLICEFQYVGNKTPLTVYMKKPLCRWNNCYTGCWKKIFEIFGRYSRP